MAAEKQKYQFCPIFQTFAGALRDVENAPPGLREIEVTATSSSRPNQRLITLSTNWQIKVSKYSESPEETFTYIRRKIHNNAQRQETQQQRQTLKPCCVIAYGISGSGKSTTFFGHEEKNIKGLIPSWFPDTSEEDLYFRAIDYSYEKGARDLACSSSSSIPLISTTSWDTFERKKINDLKDTLKKRIVCETRFNTISSRSILIIQLIDSKTNETAFFVDLPGTEDIKNLAPEGSDSQTVRLLEEQSKFFKKRISELTNGMRSQETVFTGHQFWLLLRRTFNIENLRNIYWISCAKMPLNHENCFPAVNVLASIPMCQGPENRRGNFVRLNTSRPRVEGQSTPVMKSNTLQVPSTSRETPRPVEMTSKEKELEKKEKELAQKDRELENLARQLAQSEEERKKQNEVFKKELEKSRRAQEELARQMENLTAQMARVVHVTPPRAQPVIIDLTTPPAIVKQEREDSPAPEDEESRNVEPVGAVDREMSDEGEPNEEESNEENIEIEDPLVRMSDDESDDNDEDENEDNSDEESNADEGENELTEDSENNDEEEDDEEGGDEENDNEDNDGEHDEEGRDDQDNDDEEDGTGGSDDADPNPRNVTPPPGPSRILRSQTRAGTAGPLQPTLPSPRQRRRKVIDLTPEERRLKLFRRTRLDDVQSGKLWVGNKSYDVHNPERFKTIDWKNLIEPVVDSRHGRCTTCDKVLSPSQLVGHVWGKHLRGKVICSFCGKKFRYEADVRAHQRRDNCQQD